MWRCGDIQMWGYTDVGKLHPSQHHHIATSPYHNITTSQHHNITTLQHHNITTSQHHHITTSPYHNITASQHHHITTSQHYNIATLQHHNITTSQHHHIMTHEVLEERILQFILRVIRLGRHLPHAAEAYTIKKQLLRSSTSIGANHRAMRRSRSHNEFFAKLCIVVEEADETLYWLELLVKAEIISSEKLTLLIKEANELVAIFVSMRKKAKLKKDE